MPGFINRSDGVVFFAEFFQFGRPRPRYEFIDKAGTHYKHFEWDAVDKFYVKYNHPIWVKCRTLPMANGFLRARCNRVAGHWIMFIRNVSDGFNSINYSIGGI